MNLKLDKKVALVTGSTAGIGFAIARSLAREGVQVIINGRTEKRVQEAIAEIRGAFPSADLKPLAADLSEAAGAEQAIRQCPDLDILVNNMGVYVPQPFEQITDADWLKMIETNFLSGVRLCRHYLPAMKAKNWGRIIFISSESGVNIPLEMIHYGVSKTMQIALARGLAESTVGTGVTVNSVLAGPTRSEGVEGFIANMAKAGQKTTAAIEKEFFQNVRPTSLLQRFESPDEIASMVTFVASPLSSATNGAALRAEGGVVRSIL